MTFSPKELKYDKSTYIEIHKGCFILFCFILQLIFALTKQHDENYYMMPQYICCFPKIVMRSSKEHFDYSPKLRDTFYSALSTSNGPINFFEAQD